jgi:RES domain-containing protein
MRPVQLKPNPHADRLAKGLEKCLVLAAAWENDVCRTSGTKHATIKKFADGTGAKQWGGRWNPPAVAAIYCSLDEETALVEMKQRHRRGGIPMRQMKPRVFASLHVRLRRVLDLT